jgi:hypothetical protein
MQDLIAKLLLNRLSKKKNCDGDDWFVVIEDMGLG